MNITQAAIEKKRITFTFLFLILVSGIAAYRNMPRAEDPGFIVRTALIQTFFPGASPERVELLVTDKLEKRIQEMPELDFIKSESKTGISIIYVNIKESYTDLRPIWDKMRRKVEAARGELPSDIKGPFVNDEFGDVLGTVVALRGEGYTYAELKDIADDVRNELLLIPQVAKVEISGMQEERIFVEFNGSRLAEVGISPMQLQQILTARNIIFPGGEVFTNDERITLEPSGNFESVDELRKTVIKIPGSRDVIFLDAIADVYRGTVDPPTSKATFNGERALILGISLREGGNIIELGVAVKDALQRFRQIYPIGVEFDLVYFQPDFVDVKVKDFVGNLLQSVGIVLLVMLLFLGLRTGLVVASLIPMAMVMAIMVMRFFDIGIDQMSLASLIIALGMLVDNAIVMSEAIMVAMEEGTPAKKAAADAAKELRIPLLTSSLTTAAAFLPIYLAESATGEYTAPLFKVVTITLLCSWLLSLTMTPLLCVLFLRIKKDPGVTSLDRGFYRNYRLLLVLGLKNRTLTLLTTVLMFAGSLWLFQFVDQIFFPPNDKAVMKIELEMPVGSPLAKTEAAVSAIEAYIQRELLATHNDDGSVQQHGVKKWSSFIGSGAPKYALAYNPEPPAPYYAYMLITASHRDVILDRLIPALRDFVWQAFPDLRADLGLLALGEPVDAPVQIRISGKDQTQTFDIAAEVKERLAQVPGSRNIRDDWGHRTKKLVVKINQPRAQRAGLTSQDIALSLQTVLSGITTTDYREDDQLIPVVLRSEAADRRDIGKLESHNIWVQQTGRAVPLKQVADVKVVFQPSLILRRDRLKTVTVNADTAPGSNAMAIANQMDTILAEMSRDWPIGTKYELGGELESSGKAQASIGAKLPIAAVFILLLLVSQFDSIRRPIIILLTIPLGLIGVIVGLLVTNQPFGFMAMLGVISLSGIVINNAIVLLDRIRIEMDENDLAPPQAIVEACQRRLRPILLTTMTTVGGLFPLWLGGGPLFEAMAVAIIFGLCFATVLTLGIVPIFFSVFFRVSFKDYQPPTQQPAKSNQSSMDGSLE